MLVATIVGLLIGFVSAIPVAGPVSVLVTSNGLRGELGRGVLVATGAAVIDFIYCLLAALGFSQVLSENDEIIPVFLSVGAIIVFILGLRFVIREQNIKDPQTEMPNDRRPGKHGAFWTGFVMNFFNPTIVFSWFTIIGIVSSTGIVEFGVWESILFSTFLAGGTVLWFWLFLKVLVRHRIKFKLSTLNTLIRCLGVILCGFGVYLGYRCYEYIVSSNFADVIRQSFPDL